MEKSSSSRRGKYTPQCSIRCSTTLLCTSGFEAIYCSGQLSRWWRVAGTFLVGQKSSTGNRGWFRSSKASFGQRSRCAHSVSYSHQYPDDGPVFGDIKRPSLRLANSFRYNVRRDRRADASPPDELRGKWYYRKRNSRSRGGRIIAKSRSNCHLEIITKQGAGWGWGRAGLAVSGHLLLPVAYRVAMPAVAVNIVVRQYFITGISTSGRCRMATWCRSGTDSSIWYPDRANGRIK